MKEIMDTDRLEWIFSHCAVYTDWDRSYPRPGSIQHSGGPMNATMEEFRRVLDDELSRTRVQT
jgi:hypothetical protein